MKYPIHKERWERRVDRIRGHGPNSFMWRVAPAIAFELRLLLESYYGGPWRMVWALFRLTFSNIIHTWTGRLRIWVCDRMGWTKIYFVPETDYMRAHWRRHGRKCSGSPNCDNINCIQDSVPGWYRWLTRWDKY
jgi:hypothetical protein